MGLWTQWVERPQRLWPRKLIFQIHLWVGVGVGLYVLLVSLSGSAIVYRRVLDQRTSHRKVAVPAAGRAKMTGEQLESTLRRVYPNDEVLAIDEADQSDRPDIVILQAGSQRIERLFDPYTGADLGDSRSTIQRALGWLADLHDNLLGGLTGRTLNGIGAALITLLSFTGTVIWWPGVKNWRRSTRIKWPARFARVNWDVHSAVGFWCWIFVLIWAVSGVLLCFPGAFDAFVGPAFRLWMTRLHFGRFNPITEAIWTILGLAPALLAITGALMWWNRVLRKTVRKLAVPSSLVLTRFPRQFPQNLPQHPEPDLGVVRGKIQPPD